MDTVTRHHNMFWERIILGFTHGWTYIFTPFPTIQSYTDTFTYIKKTKNKTLFYYFELTDAVFSLSSILPLFFNIYSYPNINPSGFIEVRETQQLSQPPSCKFIQSTIHHCMPSSAITDHHHLHRLGSPAMGSNSLWTPSKLGPCLHSYLPPRAAAAVDSSPAQPWASPTRFRPRQHTTTRPQLLRRVPNAAKPISGHSSSPSSAASIVEPQPSNLQSIHNHNQSAAISSRCRELAIH